MYGDNNTHVTIYNNNIKIWNVKYMYIKFVDLLLRVDGRRTNRKHLKYFWLKGRRYRDKVRNNLLEINNDAIHIASR